MQGSTVPLVAGVHQFPQLPVRFRQNREQVGLSGGVEGWAWPQDPGDGRLARLRPGTARET